MIYESEIAVDLKSNHLKSQANLKRNIKLTP